MNKTILILCSIAVGCLTVAAQDRPSFTVGTAKAARGQKVNGVIEVPAGGAEISSRAVVRGSNLVSLRRRQLVSHNLQSK